MRLLPVIDILEGVVVRGVAGRRKEYRPLQSRWADGADPLNVAAGLRSAFGFRRFYLADLDGILFRKPNRELYRELAKADCELLVDHGMIGPGEVDDILDDGVCAAIAGLESLSGPDDLDIILRRHGPERIIFSLDLQSGVPKIREGSLWPIADSLSTAERAVQCGVERMIVLDLADVGCATGGSTETLCRTLLNRHPSLRLIAGGGVRGEDDVRRWADTGVEELLVASALHNGRLSPEFVRRWS